MSVLGVDGHLGDGASALLDGELAPTDVAIAREHLAACASCTATLAAVASARSMLRSLPVVDAPAGLGERVVSRRTALLHRSAVAVSVGAVLLVAGAVVTAPAARAPVQPKVAAMSQLHLGEQVGAPALASSIAAPRTKRPKTQHVGSGAHAVTVFSESGHLDTRSLKPSATVDVGDRTAHVAGEAPAVVVVEANDAVFTAVAIDLRDAVAALERLIGIDERSLVDRAHDAAQDLVGAFGFSP